MTGNTTLRKHLYIVAVAMTCVACEECFPGKVAQGVSRLTMRNFGALVQLVNDDAVCGFESQAVKDNYEIIGTSGEQGVVVYRVEQCAIDVAAEAPAVTTDCNDVATAVAGRVVVTANRIIEGYLTGDPAEPVIPKGADAVTIEIVRADLHRFQVDATDGPEFMIWIRGAISGKLKPRLAASNDTGVCRIPTPNVVMSDVRYEDATVRVVTKSRDFLVPIPTSNLGAVNGLVGDRENVLFGSVTVWESPQEVPVNDGEHGLNPDYDSATHVASYECTDNLALPIDFDTCTTDIRPLIAQGASQLSVQMIGQLASYLDEDERCGFASPQVNGAVEITGAVGARGGQGQWRIDTPCELTFPAETVLDEDCNGKKVYARGTVRLTGSKILRGIPSGDSVEPVVPTSRDPATVFLRADFTDFSLWADPGQHKLTVVSGGLSATIHPRVAKDTVQGACSIKTPNSGFSGITLSDARLVIDSDGRRFEVTADTSTLDAQNGSKDGRTNYLAGTIVLDGETFDIPVGDEPVLDPDYDAASFVAAYACKPNIHLPAKDEECNMKQTLAEGAARLLVFATGAVTSVTNANKDCGFEAIRVLLRPSDVQGDPEAPGSMEWTISDCDISRGSGSDPYETDCLGRRKFMEGGAQVDARRRVVGLREKLINIGSVQLIDSIIPQDHTSVEIELQAVDLSDFFAFELDPGHSFPTKGIRIDGGQLHAIVNPITGENDQKAGAYDVATSIAHMTAIRLTNADATILYQGKTFDIHIDDAQLEAFNGSYAASGMTNMIVGRIRVDGHEVVFGPGSALDPEYDQADFDARYICTEDLAGLVPSAP